MKFFQTIEMQCFVFLISSKSLLLSINEKLWKAKSKVRLEKCQEGKRDGSFDVILGSQKKRLKAISKIKGSPMSSVSCFLALIPCVLQDEWVILLLLAPAYSAKCED